jgi:phosphoribosylamine--glycine ligase
VTAPSSPGVARRFRVLLYGKDARTDAIADAIQRAGREVELAVCAPIRIPGLVARADRYLLAPMTDLEAMMAAAREAEPDLVVIGPEDPLSVGLADAFMAAGVPCMGPERELARIETSKSWARRLVEEHELADNPLNKAFDNEDGLAEYVAGLGHVVVKPDGLTGGKGVKVMGEQLADAAEAIEYARAILAEGTRVVIEERLIGEEFSLMTLTDGESAVHCPLVQDHKRAFAGDIGPNTGGMGSYSCADHSMPYLDDGDVAKARQINEGVIAALASATGRPYRGVLYGGFMAVSDGVRLIEYNARFGDPEAMNVLPLMTSDFVEVALAIARGGLGDIDVKFDKLATVCKYVVPAAYPDPSDGDLTISADDKVLANPGLRRYWAAAELGEGGETRLTGSRGLAFVGLAEELPAAEAIAEQGAASVSGPVRHRADIGTMALVASRVAHMAALRAAADL